MMMPSMMQRMLSRVIPLELHRSLCGTITDQLRPEVVLSETNRKSFVERFKRIKPKTDINNEKYAAVLIPLCMYKGELGLLYTLRSTKLNAHRGQVSFPGGMQDEADANFEETALRETWEELRIPQEKVDVWCAGNIIGKRYLNAIPVFGYIGEVVPEQLQVNPSEVEEAFVVNLRTLCDPSLFRTTKFRAGYTLPAYLGGKYRVWGFTGVITHLALSALLPGTYKHELPPQVIIDSTQGQTVKKL